MYNNYKYLFNAFINQFHVKHCWYGWNKSEIGIIQMEVSAMKTEKRHIL